MRTTLLFMSLLSTASAQWQKQAIATDADFRGLAVVDAKTAWVSGTLATVARTIDGATWEILNIPDTGRLDFRDVKAFSKDVAYVLSIGPGGASRIYKTTDGGKTWQLQFKNTDVSAFYDCMAFWDETHGLALSDPVDGKYRIIATNDGLTWSVLPEARMPAALAKEGAFAASGTCLITRGQNDAWFVTGGGPKARVFHTVNRGTTWTVQDTPITGGVDSAGAFAIEFRDDKIGMIVGGDYAKPTDTGATMAVTRDGGKTWEPLAKKLPFRSGIAWAKDRWIAVGTSGSEESTDDGVTWKNLDQEKYNAVRFTKDGTGWAVGPKGMIAKRNGR